MLQDNFFAITYIQNEVASAKALLELNSTHPIFKGHFPSQPVVPGACLLQMVKEVVQHITGSTIQLLKAHHLKFITLIDPVKNKTLHMALTYSVSENGELAVSATLSYDDAVAFKFNGIFRTILTSV